MKLLKIFEYIYLALSVFAVYITISEWERDRIKSYTFIGLGIVSLLMFFFRRYYRIRFERKKNK